MEFTLTVRDAKAAAFAFQLALIDRGHTFTERRDGVSYIIESDGKTVRFVQGGR